MNRFVKMTVGFVFQQYERKDNNHFVCVEQAFIAGDEVTYENEKGESLSNQPQYSYEPLEMKSPSGQRLTFQFYNEAFGSLEPDRIIQTSSREEALEQALLAMGYTLVPITNQLEKEHHHEDK